MKQMNPRLVERNNHQMAIPSIKYVKVLINISLKNGFFLKQNKTLPFWIE